MKTPRGNAIIRAISELTAVPITNGIAPYRSLLTSQTVLVKKLRPVFWIAGQAGVMILSRIQSKVKTAAAEASQVSTRKRSSLRRLPVILLSAGIVVWLSDITLFSWRDVAQRAREVFSRALLATPREAASSSPPS